jgi:hypothetical protein
MRKRIKFLRVQKKQVFVIPLLLISSCLNAQTNPSCDDDISNKFSVKVSSQEYSSVFSEDLLQSVIGWKLKKNNDSLHITFFSREGFSDNKLHGLCVIASVKGSAHDSVCIQLENEDSLFVNILDDSTQVSVHFIVDPIPYPVRFSLVEQLSKKYPLHFGKDAKGYWAGIYYFSKWQYNSGRDVLPIWEKVNRSFTVNPYLISLFSKDSAEIPFINKAVEADWNKVFDKNRNQRKDLKILWTAHANALADGMQRMEKELDSLHVPEEEIRFWRGRVKVIFFLSRVNFPTIKNVVVPIINLLEPRCSPIGCKDCKVNNMNSGVRESYLRLLMWLGKTKIQYKKQSDKNGQLAES